jgi:hypothetical protein
MGMTPGVRDTDMAGSVFGVGWAVLERRPRNCVPDNFTAWSFSAWEREPSFYWGLIGPSLHSVHQGGITSCGGLRPEGRDQIFSGCSPLYPLRVRIETEWTARLSRRLSDPESDYVA